jgi:hypothetical protein
MRALAFCAALLGAACSSPSPAPLPKADAGVIEARDAAAIEAGDSGTVEPDATVAPDAADAADAGLDAGTVEPADAGMMTAPDSGVASAYGPYGADGVETFTTLSIEVTNADRTFDAHFHLPDSIGPLPVVVFAPGTQQPASSYETFFRRLASHGLIVMAKNDPGPFTPTQEVVEDLEYLATTWLPAANGDSGSPFFGRVDLTRIGVAGHSRGGKATLLAAEFGLMGHVVAYFGVDTIDVTFIDDGIYAQTEVATVGIPTLFLVATAEGGCSPAHSNGEVIYDLASTPSVLLRAIDADHSDFAVPCVGCLIACGARTGTADAATVRDYTARYLMAFFARELLGDAAVGPALEGAGSLLDEAAGLVSVSSK